MEKNAGSDSYTYISSWVFLPTYISVAVIALGGLGGGPGNLYVLVALLATCVVLEFIYRCVFGPARLTRKVGFISFASQLVAWAAVWTSMYLVSVR